MVTLESIKDLRENSNYSQKELAKILQNSASCLSKYETGHTQPSLDMLVQIADVLNTSTDYLLNRNSFQFNYQTFESAYIKGLSVFALFNEILKLDKTNRRRLVDYVGLLANDMKISQLKK